MLTTFFLFFLVMTQNPISTQQSFSVIDSLTHHSANQNGYFCKSYTLKAEQKTEFRIYVSSFTFNPHVKLFKEDQLVVKTTGSERYYDAGKDYSVTLKGFLEPKTGYELIVSTEKKGDTGEFSLEYIPSKKLNKKL